MLFYLTYNGTRKQVKPKGAFALKFDKEEHCVGFRKKWGAEVTLTDYNATDYTFVKNIETSNKFAEIGFEVERKQNGQYVPYWIGYFTPFGCKWDDDNATVSFIPTVNDSYRRLIENYDLEKNILDITPAPAFAQETLGDMEILTIKQFLPVQQDQTGYGSPYVGFAPANINAYNAATLVSKSYGWNGQYFEPRYLSQAGTLQQWDWAFHDKPTAQGLNITDNYVLYKMEYTPLGTGYGVTMSLARQIKITLDINGVATPPTPGLWNEIEVTTLAGLPAHKYARNWAETLTLFNFDERFKRIANADGSFYYKRTTAGGDTYNRGRWIADVLQYFLTDYELNLSSRFFTDETNPVTGEAQNPTKYLQMLQKTDAKTPASTEPAMIGKIKFSELLSYLVATFNLRWYINGSDFIVEHISTFGKQQTKDLRSFGNGKFVRHLNKYEYSSDEIPSKIAFSWMDKSNDVDFTGVPIEFDATNTSGKNKDNTKTIAISKFTTDLNAIRTLPTSISNDGFALISVINEDGAYIVRDKVGILSNYVKLNGWLTNSNLVELFYNDEMPIITGKVNGVQKTFNSQIRRKKQSNISFPDDLTEYNGFSLVRSDIGWGEISDLELDLVTNTYKCSILHD